MKTGKWLRLTVALFALTALLLCCSALAEGDGNTTYRAMLVGVDNYESNPLSGCITDANRMASMLAATDEAGVGYTEDNITVRTNLTSTELQDVLNGMSAWGADDDDVTFFYFSGHGFLNNGTAAGIVGKDRKSVALTTVRKFLDEVQGTKIVVVDARYLDSLLDTTDPAKTLSDFNTTVCEAFADGDYYVFSCATRMTDAQNASSAMSESCGVATLYLAEACGYDYLEQRPVSLAADINGNGAVTLAEAMDYVTGKLTLLGGEESSYLAAVKVSPESGTFPIAARRGSVEILEIGFEKEEINLATGRGVQLTCETKPVNASTRGITWTSSDLSVASVSSGYVTGIKPGVSYVLATSSNGLSAIVKVNVVDVTFIESLSLDTEKRIVAANTTTKLEVTKVPEYATEDVIWSSSNEAVAMVDQEGYVTSIGIGDCVITCASEGGVTTQCSVQVAEANKVVSALALSSDKITLYAGEAEIIKYKTNPKNVLDDSVYTISSDESVVTGSNTNRITAVSAGTATVRVIATSGVYADCQVTVKTPTIKLNKKSIDIKEAATATLTATITPTLLSKQITWASSDETVATVDINGKVTGVALGECTVTATAPGGAKAECAVTVSGVDVTSIKLDTVSKTVTVNETFTISATVKPDNASLKSIKWTSSDEAVATVSDTGYVTARAAGNVTISATSHNKKTASCKLTVKPIAVTEVTLSETSISLVKGVEGLSAVQLTANTQPVEAGNGSLKWKSSDPEVAKVDASGKVTAVGKGKCTIRAMSLSSKKVYADVTVKVEENVAQYSKPVYDANEYGLYTSARKIGYQKNKLCVDLYFYNYSARKLTVPEEGTLVLTLADGTTYELMQIKAGNTEMKAKKLGRKTYRVDVSDKTELQGLDLRGATATIVTAADTTETVEETAEETTDETEEALTDEEFELTEEDLLGEEESFDDTDYESEDEDFGI